MSSHPNFSQAVVSLIQTNLQQRCDPCTQACELLAGIPCAAAPRTLKSSTGAPVLIFFLSFFSLLLAAVQSPSVPTVHGK